MSTVRTAIILYAPRLRGIWPSYRNLWKRLLDCALVLISLPVVFLVLAPIVLAVLVREGHTPFYSQQRIGKDGRTFRIWKLRTMVPDADAMLERHLRECPAARAEWDRTQKLVDDPRITPIGRFLRRSSLDELPQLWNVLTGDMSLVGPRPMMPSQQQLYPSRSYYRLRPGLTGPWQVSDRHLSAFADRARFDDLYDATLNLATDIGLILRTFRVVLRGTGC